MKSVKPSARYTKTIWVRVKRTEKLETDELPHVRSGTGITPLDTVMKVISRWSNYC